MKHEFNVTNNVLDVREMTDQEIEADKTHRLAVTNKLKAEQAKAATKEAARKALLDRLGITADEAKLLLG